jgi:hypothetical protein
VDVLHMSTASRETLGSAASAFSAGSEAGSESVIDFGAFGSALGRSDTGMSRMTGQASMESESTGTSSQRFDKKERKAWVAVYLFKHETRRETDKASIAQAEKEAVKAAARAKFEAARAVQMHKMRMDKAAAQAKVEMARLAPKVRVEPKTKLGRFGAKFSAAVLFPEGGNNGTMF